MEAMPRKLPPFVVKEFNRHGNIRFYFRRGKGARIRLPNDISSEEFKAAYESALSGSPASTTAAAPVNSKSVRWLISRYKESGAWKALSGATRYQRDRIFENVIKAAGNDPYVGITKKTMQKAMEKRIDTPAQANSVLKAMRGLFAWALKNEHVSIDPTVGVERVAYKSDGFPPWTIADAEAFCRRWPIGTKPRLAFELYLSSGLRRGDMHIAGRQHMRGKVFSIKTQKTGAEVTIQFSDRLMGIIDATPTGDLRFLVKDNGEPFTSKFSFGNWFGARCRDADIEKSAHGLRKLAATMAADSGGTTHELMSHFGWLKVDQAEIYTKGADRKRLGIQSSKRLADQIKNISDPAPKSQVRGKRQKK
jgi:integrase